MTRNIIWSNDTEHIEAIIEEWKDGALRLTEGMADDPNGTLREACAGERIILDKAWNGILDEGRSPAARRLHERIESDDWSGDIDLLEAAVMLNDECRGDERDNLAGLELERPVVLIGEEGLWDGPRAIACTRAARNVGDIIAGSPWNGMEHETWSIDGNDDLRYEGMHHDGVNTCIFRELNPGARPSSGDLVRGTRPLGPRIRQLYGMPRA